MKTYKVSLTRIYVVDVEAETEEKACHYAEYFTGNPSDDSNEKDRKEGNFSIGNEMKMVWNEATLA
ncbi:hypothetical protein [Candidatus Mycalebacterium sp.]